MAITGFDYVQVAIPAGSQDDARAKAHPAFLVDDLDALQAHVADAGYECVRTDGEIPGVTRLHTEDAAGNRVEFRQA